jgi:hypothetical protein
MEAPLVKELARYEPARSDSSAWHELVRQELFQYQPHYELVSHEPAWPELTRRCALGRLSSVSSFHTGAERMLLGVYKQDMLQAP